MDSRRLLPLPCLLTASVASAGDAPPAELRLVIGRVVREILA